MKTWHMLLPLIAMASMGFAFEKRERDAAIAELRTAREALEKSGPLLQRRSSATLSEGQSPGRTTTTGAAAGEQYQRAFESESRDAAWADSAERIAGERLKALVPPGATVRTIECHASMCRFETSHTDRSSYEKFVRSTFIGPSAGIWNAPEFSGLLEPSAEHASLLAVSYLAREGRTLPAVD